MWHNAHINTQTAPSAKDTTVFTHSVNHPIYHIHQALYWIFVYWSPHETIFKWLSLFDMVHYPGRRRNYKTVICGGHKQINMVSTLMLWYSNDDSLVLRSLKSLYFGSKSPGQVSVCTPNSMRMLSQTHSSNRNGSDLDIIYQSSAAQYWKACACCILRLLFLADTTEGLIWIFSGVHLPHGWLHCSFWAVSLLSTVAQMCYLGYLVPTSQVWSS